MMLRTLGRGSFHRDVDAGVHPGLKSPYPLMPMSSYLTELAYTQQFFDLW